ncbi:hypothetical protein JCM11251_007097 [Rhodosporidiobolus azoricus]
MPDTYEGTTLHTLLGEHSASPVLTAYLSSLRQQSSSSISSTPEPDVKIYSDTLFHNHLSLGLSLSFSPLSPSPSLNLKTASPSLLASLPLSGIDICNHTTPAPPSSAARAASTSAKQKDPEYKPFPAYPILLPTSASSPSSFALSPSTTGAQLVEALGEPARKGGGGVGMGVWTEWVFSLHGEGGERKEGQKVAVMVEWASSGLGAWEKGGESGWRVLSVYSVEEKGDGKKG